MTTRTDPLRPSGATRWPRSSSQTLDAAEGAQALPGADASQDGFGDISGSAHAANIRRLFGAAIVSSRDETHYAQREPVTRGQMATFLLRAAEFAAGLEQGSLDSQQQASPMSANATPGSPP